MNRLICLALLFIGLSACVGTMLPHVSPAQAEWAGRKWPGMDAAQLEAARVLYVDRCSGCHNLVLPETRSLEKWDVVLSSMAPRAKLTPDEREKIWRYISVVKSS